MWIDRRKNTHNENIDKMHFREMCKMYSGILKMHYVVLRERKQNALWVIIKIE